MKKIIISVFFIIFFSGCYNYKELNDYSIVTGIAIDKNDDKYEVSVLISNSSKKSSDNSQSEAEIIVYSGTGDTIYSAIKDVELISPKELYLGHLSVLVISEKLSKNGINNILDYFLRNPNIKKNFLVTISKNCNAKDTLKIITPLSDFPSQNIADNILSTNKLQGMISNMNFNELLSNIKTNGKEATINSIEIIGRKESGTNNENIEKSDPNTYIKLSTLAIFKEDKLIKFATDTESIGINILNNKAKEIYIKFKYNNSDIVINTDSFKSKIKIKIINNTPIVNVDVLCDAKIVEVDNNINLNDNNIIKTITFLAEKQLKNYINEGINVAKINNTDIFGLNLKVYQNHPTYYKNKNEINLNDFIYKIKTIINIKNKGSSTNSLGVNYEKD